jgi:hypothetical protein
MGSGCKVFVLAIEPQLPVVILVVINILIVINVNCVC